MHIVDDVVLGGWVVFWAYWLVASRGVKEDRSRSSRFVDPRAGVLLIVLLLIRTGVGKGHATTTTDTAVQGVGIALFSLGLAVAVWARLPSARTGECRGPRRSIRNW